MYHQGDNLISCKLLSMIKKYNMLCREVEKYKQFSQDEFIEAIFLTSSRVLTVSVKDDKKGEEVS